MSPAALQRLAMGFGDLEIAAPWESVPTVPVGSNQPESG